MRFLSTLTNLRTLTGTSADDDMEEVVDGGDNVGCVKLLLELGYDEDGLLGGELLELGLYDNDEMLGLVGTGGNAAPGLKTFSPLDDAALPLDDAVDFHLETIGVVGRGCGVGVGEDVGCVKLLLDDICGNLCCTDLAKASMNVFSGDNVGCVKLLLELVYDEDGLLGGELLELGLYDDVEVIGVAGRRCGVGKEILGGNVWLLSTKLEWLESPETCCHVSSREVPSTREA
jgi:hypothetical protein